MRSNEKELEKLTQAKQKRLEAELATSKLEAAQAELKASQEAMKKASESEKTDRALQLKEAQDKLEDAKKVEREAKSAAEKATQEAPDNVDESVETLATLQAELAVQKDANVGISETETETLLNKIRLIAHCHLRAPWRQRCVVFYHLPWDVRSLLCTPYILAVCVIVGVGVIVIGS